MKKTLYKIYRRIVVLLIYATYPMFLLGLKYKKKATIQSICNSHNVKTKTGRIEQEEFCRIFKAHTNKQHQMN